MSVPGETRLSGVQADSRGDPSIILYLIKGITVFSSMLFSQKRYLLICAEAPKFVVLISNPSIEQEKGERGEGGWEVCR